MFKFPEPSDELVRRYEVSGPRYTSYPTVVEWTDGFGHEQYAARLEAAGRTPELPLSLYTHLPFCREMCTYCGCNVVITRDSAKADRYLDVVGREIGMAAERLGARRNLAQMHWGGGTPTFLSIEQIERLWKEIFGRFKLLPDAEVAIEIDPVVTTHEQLALLRRLGFNRLSMGVQDFEPKVQQAVNRIQPADDTQSLVEYSRSLGFGAINFDLIYGLPFQTPESWGRTLERVIAMRPDRMAVYSFAYVPEVRPHQKKIDRAWLPLGKDKLRLFLQAYEAFVNAGYKPIGMDHFALPEDELSRAQARRGLGRNFQGYTVTAAPDSVAFGATGISDVAGAFSQNVRPLGEYYESIQSGCFAVERGLELTDDDKRRRALITQLMCNFWVDLGTDGYFDSELEKLRPFEKDGLLKIDGHQFELSTLGRLFVRNVAMIFDAYRATSQATFSRTV